MSKYDFKIVEMPFAEKRFYKRNGHKIRRIVMHALDNLRSDQWILDYLEKAKFFYDAMVASDGTVYTFNPRPDLLASKHTSGNNLWTYGILLNMPTKMKKGKEEWRESFDFLPSKVHGVKGEFAVPTNEQIISTATLVTNILKHLGLELQHTDDRKVLPKKVLDTITLSAHYQHQRNRTDPGPHAMDAIFHELVDRERCYDV